MGLVLITLIFFYNTSKTEYHAVTSSASPVPPQDGEGIYESCLPGNPSCNTNLDVMEAGGFSLVINYSQFGDPTRPSTNPTMSDELNYAAHAAQDHMKVIWSLKDWWSRESSLNGNELLLTYPHIAQTCGCSNNAGFIQYFINAVKNLPGTWGYYIADEATTSNYTQVKVNLADLVHATDPNKPRLYVAGSSGPYMNSAVNMYANISEVIAQDYYPIGNQPSLPINGVSTIASSLQSLANTAGKSYGMVLQAHSLAPYLGYCQNSTTICPYPTTAQMTQMLGDVLNYPVPRLVLWYSFFDIAYSAQWTNLVHAIASFSSTPSATSTQTPTPTATPSPSLPTQTPTMSPTIITNSPTHVQTPTPTPTKPITTSHPTPTSIATSVQSSTPSQVNHTMTATKNPTTTSIKTVTPSVYVSSPVSVKGGNIQFINSLTHEPLVGAFVTYIVNNQSKTVTTGSDGSITPMQSGDLQIREVKTANKVILTFITIHAQEQYQIEVNPEKGQIGAVFAYTAGNNWLWSAILVVGALFATIGAILLLKMVHKKFFSNPFL